jgi:hypothetical protein
MFNTTDITSGISAASQYFGLSQKTSDTMGIGAGIGALFSNLQQYSQAADLAQQGGAMSASAYRQAGDQAISNAQYNISILQQNLNTQLQTFNSNQVAYMSSMQNRAAANNLAPSSQSYRLLQASSLNEFDRQANQLRLSAINQQNYLQYQARVQSVTSENQARIAEYNAAVQKSQIESQQTGAAMSGFASLAMSAMSAYK